VAQVKNLARVRSETKWTSVVPMAAFCPDTRQCCALICVAVAPQTSQAIGLAPQASQTMAVAPGQMVFMTPFSHGGGVVPSMPSGLYQGSGAEFEGLGLGWPLPVGFPCESVAMQPMQPPIQFSMEPVWEPPRNIQQHQNAVEFAWSGDAAAWTRGAATIFDSDAQATEQWFGEPEEEQMETGTNTDQWGISASTLRRRRRQRAAARVPEAVSGEQEVKPPVEQSLELVMQVRAGGEASRSAASRFRRLAFSNQESCRVAQLALEEATPNEAVMLLNGLRGHVRDALKSMFCNYVLQRAVELLPNESTNFIPHELIGIGKEVACHRFGCRILCRLLEHGSLEEASKQALLEEVLADTDSLSRHAYGNFVLRHLLEFGHPWHQHSIATALCTNIVETAKDQNGSHVVESAVEFCETADKHAIADALLSDPDEVRSLATDNYGRHAVKALLKTPGVWQEHIAAILSPSKRALKESKQGRPVLQALQAFESKRPNIV